MKKWIAGLLCLCALLTLCACGSDGDAKNWTFQTGSVTIEIGGNCADALKTLESTCKNKSATGSCWKDTGEDVVYQFDGFRLKTYRTKENDPKETLLAVEFTTDGVKTPEGITVGSTTDAVKKAYGTPTTEDSSTLTYDRGTSRLRFTLRDGKVTGVSYLAL